MSASVFPKAGTELATPTALLAELRAAASREPRLLWDMLERAVGADPAECAKRLGAALRMPVVDMADLYGLTPDFSRIPFDECVRRMCVVCGGAEEPAIALTCDPFNTDGRTWLEARTGRALHWHLVHRNDLEAFFKMAEERHSAVQGVLASVSRADSIDSQVMSDLGLTLASIASDASPVVRLVHSTVFDALKQGASDIHLETNAAGLQIKYRIDGVLTLAAAVPGSDMAEQIISRIKVMAELDIAERRVPQDGRIRLAVNGRDIDFRVSIMPSLFGEDAVIRVLDKRSLTNQMQELRLELLGFEGEVLTGLRRMAREPYGMLLVTGPTGSGKTTTLYAALSEINSGLDKIITIEDPVEYELPGILQIPVNEKKGLGFARGLRSILRHDPDKILVGEIRDPETAQIAIQSALTGHLVFTSVHANNVFDVLGRFLHMGVDTYSFVSALNGILAQRLVRVNCAECAIEQELEPLEVSARLKLSVDPSRPIRVRHGRGCGSCRGTGFRGRRTISELLRLNDDLRELIIARAPIRDIKNAAQQAGTKFLRQSAIEAVLAGWTTLDEIDRVTFSE